MAKFDKELDKVIDKKVLAFENTQIIVAKHSYNEGAEKIQISRLNKKQDTDDWVFSKLGRLTKDEAIATAGALADMVASMS